MVYYRQNYSDFLTYEPSNTYKIPVFLTIPVLPPATIFQYGWHKVSLALPNIPVLTDVPPVSDRADRKNHFEFRIKFPKLRKQLPEFFHNFAGR